MKLSKRVMKRTAAAAAAAVLAASMAACQGQAKLSPEEVIAKSTENLNAADSMSYDMVFNIAMSAMGIDLDMEMKGTSDYIREPMAFSMDMEMDMSSMGQGSQQMQMYMTESEDGGLVIYSGVDDGTGSTIWSKQEVDSIDDIQEQLGMMNSTDQLKKFTDNSMGFVEAGAEDVNGVSAVRYDGVVSKESMQEVMSSLNMGDFFESMGLDEAALEAYTEGISDIKISIWVDMANMMPVKYQLDMTEFMQSMMTSFMKEMLKQYGQEDMDLGSLITISNVAMDAEITNINGVDSIEIPKEALNA